LDGFIFNGEKVYLGGNPDFYTNVSDCGNQNRIIYSYFRGKKPVIVIGCRHESPESYIAAIRGKYVVEEAEDYIDKVNLCLKKLIGNEKSI